MPCDISFFTAEYPDGSSSVVAVPKESQELAKYFYNTCGAVLKPYVHKTKHASEGTQYSVVHTNTQDMIGQGTK